MTNPYPIPRAIRQTDILLGNGGYQYGPFDGLQCFDVEDIRVYTRASGQEAFSLTAATVNKVSGLSFDFFTIAFGFELPGTTEYIVSSERVPERSAGVIAGSRVDPTALEKELSKVTTVAQELRRDIDRSIKPTPGAEPQDLPSPVAGKVLGWAGGKLVNLDAVAQGSVLFGDKGRELAASADTESALEVLATALWDSVTKKTMDERSRRQAHIADFSVDPTGTHDDISGLRLMVQQGQTRGVPIVIGNDAGVPGKFIQSGELEITRAGQQLIFESTGYGGYGDNGFSNWKFSNTLIGVGTFPKRVRTRRKYRASAADPQDDPMSCMLNIQAEGVELINPSLWLDCDYSNLDPENLGADCDLGIGVFTRTGVKIRRPVVTGYFRKASMLYDVTNGFGYPRLVDVNGSLYPESSVNSGGDGCLLESPQIRGGRVGLAIVGAAPKAGQTDYTTDYYDQQLGGTITDRRGSSGFSDFLVIGGEIYGPDHHSGWRRKDPELIGGVLSGASLANEPDYAPAACWIDGLAGNPRASLWGMRFVGTRFATFEAFRIRLGRAARTAFYSCHTEGRGGGRKTATGVEIANNDDYVSTCWGDLCGSSATVGFTAIDTVRQTFATFAPHFYGDTATFPPTWSGYNGVSQEGSSYATQFRAPSGEGQLWGATGSGVRTRSGSTTIFSTGGGLLYDQTTASAANMYCASNGVLQRSTSSGQYKTEIEDLSPERRDAIMNLRPVWYRSTCEADRAEWSWYGLIAEEVAEVDPRLVHWRTQESYLVERIALDDNGEEIVEFDEHWRELETPVAEGVAYDRLVVHLIAKVQQLSAEVEALKSAPGGEAA